MHGPSVGALLGAVAAAGILLTAFPGAAAELVLYDQRSFGGRAIPIDGPVADLGALNFDNQAASLVISSGTWRLFRNGGFEGGSITLGPGQYPNLEAVGFPRDKLSSISPLVGGPTGPTASACPPPYLLTGADGACAFDCAAGSVPDEASHSCVCPAGSVEIGKDKRTRRLCGALLAAAPQPAPGTGTLAPKAKTKAVACAGNLQQAGTDGAGRPICRPVAGGQVTAAAVTYKVPAAEAFDVASAAGFLFRSENLSATSCTVRRIPSGIELAQPAAPSFVGSVAAGALLRTTKCTFSIFGGRDLAPGWQLTGSRTNTDGATNAARCRTFAEASGEPYPPGTSPFRPFAGLTFMSAVAILQTFVDFDDIRGCVFFPINVTEIQLQGPAGSDWHEAFAN